MASRGVAYPGPHLHGSARKIFALLSVNDPMRHSGLRSGVVHVHEFSCAGCSVCYVGETTRFFTRHVREHLSTERNTPIGTDL